jgi:phage gp46-like protein
MSTHKQDIGFFEGALGNGVDIRIENGDLKADNTFETSVMISLFSDRYVDQENLPDGITDVAGWWGDLVNENDDPIGSRFRLLYTSKTVNETIVNMENYALEALQWMLDEGIAATITASASRTGTFEYSLEIEITKPNGENIPFDFIWDGQALKVGI